MKPIEKIAKIEAKKKIAIAKVDAKEKKQVAKDDAEKATIGVKAQKKITRIEK
ncbi:MAG: hypothetical protein WC375_04810 [Methanomassiliicoccales archaeon]|jgi:hypothetical protein